MKKKLNLNANANSSMPIVNLTTESQSFHEDANSNKYTESCKSQSEPNYVEGKHKSILTQNTLKVIRDDGGWLDDQIIKASMDVSKTYVQRVP